MVAITATAAITTATRYLDSHLQEVISETPFQVKTLTGLCLHVQMKVTTKSSLVIHMSWLVKSYEILFISLMLGTVSS